MYFISNIRFGLKIGGQNRGSRIKRLQKQFHLITKYQQWHSLQQLQTALVMSIMSTAVSSQANVPKTRLSRSCAWIPSCPTDRLLKTTHRWIIVSTGRTEALPIYSTTTRQKVPPTSPKCIDHRTPSPLCILLLNERITLIQLLKLMKLKVKLKVCPLKNYILVR